ncbi:unannotated protein [freshwater metagenome]|uniref:Unannotated protein n=1 Tax=freshwater metagenome TaxID=449393 RepID=A0A6J6KL29_9ZZZZ
MYWPSRVRPHGMTVKQTSGNKTSGRKVPGIWTAKRNMATRVNWGMRKVMPMATSHQPMAGTTISGVHQYTVFASSSAAGESPRGFSTPNQMKMTPMPMRRNGIPILPISSTMVSSRALACARRSLKVDMG